MGQGQPMDFHFQQKNILFFKIYYYLCDRLNNLDKHDDPNRPNDPNLPNDPDKHDDLDGLDDPDGSNDLNGPDDSNMPDDPNELDDSDGPNDLNLHGRTRRPRWARRFGLVQQFGRAKRTGQE